MSARESKAPDFVKLGRSLAANAMNLAFRDSQPVGIRRICSSHLTKLLSEVSSSKARISGIIVRVAVLAGEYIMGMVIFVAWASNFHPGDPSGGSRGGR